MLSGVEAGAAADAWRQIEAALAEYDGPGGFTGPCEMLVVSGTRP
ncbi:MAG: hypothetical protein R2731_16130 [Nocardioides sp.]